MKIGEVAKQTGLTTKTIRFYEEKGIVSAPERQDNGYRDYRDVHLQALLLIKRARMIGFSLEESGALLALSRDSGRTAADVKAKAEQKLVEIDRKIDELMAMKTTLQALTQACPGDGQSQCPILDALVKDGDIQNQQSDSVDTTETHHCCSHHKNSGAHKKNRD
ncbi:hypothetical protein VST7929_02051 [Vibrio stylophorae]|uniref:HTH-type transcriptional regulator CueR n=1 Tax=Vibrio stylophorae TaxID=659351 RepID=A0ABN8DZC2_9VIBR|nr:hypothetical protein VST7929_02051 [Vibrio stylophorae]